MRCWYDTVQTDPKISPQISALSFRTRWGLRLNSRFTKHSFNCTSVPPATAILVSELFVPSTKGNERNELRNENNSPHTRKKEWEKSQRASMPRREQPMGVWGKHGKWGGGTPLGGGSLTPCCPGEPGAQALQLLTSSFLAPQVHLICSQTPFLLGNKMQFFLSYLWKKCNLCLCLGESFQSSDQVSSTHETVGAFTWSQCCLLKQKLKIFN